MSTDYPSADLSVQTPGGRAFVIRPFGTKETNAGDLIDFECVHDKLIAVALQRAGFSGGTTEAFMEQGSIHEDMFREIVIADLVIADVSIHNANAFYELGIRHALRKGHTIIIRADKFNDKRVFDLNSEKNLSYSLDDPASSVDKLVATITQTLEQTPNDSPVFRLLPNLKTINPADAQLVPADVRESISEILHDKSIDKAAQLTTLKSRVRGRYWEREAFLYIARAQSTLPDHYGAIESWEYLRLNGSRETEANQQLATSYQKTGELAKSEIAALRCLQSTSLSDWCRAETHALVGSNLKRRWLAQLDNHESLDERQRTAMSSPLLRKAYDAYSAGFESHQSHFYSGLNAAILLSVELTLAEQHPIEWAYLCEADDRDPAYTLKARHRHLTRLVAATELAIKASQRRSDVDNSPWDLISRAELMMVSSDDTPRVVAAYQRLRHLFSGIVMDVTLEQMAMYRKLGVFTDQQLAVTNYLQTLSVAAAPNNAP